MGLYRPIATLWNGGADQLKFMADQLKLHGCVHFTKETCVCGFKMPKKKVLQTKPKWCKTNRGRRAPTYGPDIGYGVTIPSKFSSSYSDHHSSSLNNLDRYICITIYQGIRYKLIGPWMDIPDTKYRLIVWDENPPNPINKLIRDNWCVLCMLHTEMSLSRGNPVLDLLLYFPGLQLCKGQNSIDKYIQVHGIRSYCCCNWFQDC